MDLPLFVERCLSVLCLSGKTDRFKRNFMFVDLKTVLLTLATRDKLPICIWYDVVKVLTVRLLKWYHCLGMSALLEKVLLRAPFLFLGGKRPIQWAAWGDFMNILPSLFSFVGCRLQKNVLVYLERLWTVRTEWIKTYRHHKRKKIHGTLLGVQSNVCCEIVFCSALMDGNNSLRLKRLLRKLCKW